jgi:hypothetical protein
MARHAPPEEITLVYRPVGPSHVFTALGYRMSGFHISHYDLKTAYEWAEASLGPHVKLIYGIEADYEIPMGFETFKRHITGHQKLEDANKVTARIHEKAAA